MSAPLLQGFGPIAGDHARVLVLGSFPSVQSLAAGEYYANPRNAFWPIASEVFGFETSATYDARLAALTSHGVALWDVLARCRRAGSADAKIERESLVINDFRQFFADHPAIAWVYFNGAKAETLYRMLAPTVAGIRYERLPSTSPAHAVRPGTKVAVWRTAFSASL